MILYHAITTYHLLLFIVHKLAYKRSEKAVIVYPQVLFDKYPQLETSINTFFDEAYQIYGSSREDVPSITNLGVFGQRIHEIELFTEIYIAGAQNAMAFWLVEKGIPFIFVEEACGRVSRPEVIMKNDQDMDVYRYSKAVEYGLYTGENELIKKVMCNVLAQKEGWDNEKKYHFDLFEEMKKLSQSQKEKIMKFFNAPQIEGEEGTIVLTQHFANLHMMSYKEQIEIYKSLVGYFIDTSNIFFKLHPDDVAAYEKEIYGIKVINEKYPSELIPMLLGNAKKWNLLTVSSTGIHALAENFGKTISFDVAYEKKFVENAIFYSILKILVYQGAYSNIIVDQDIFQQFIHIRNIVTKDEFKIFYSGQHSKYYYDECTSMFLDNTRELDEDIRCLLSNGGTFICREDNPILYRIISEYTSINVEIKKITYRQMEEWCEQKVFFITKHAERAKMIMNSCVDFERKEYDISIHSGVLDTDSRANAILEGQLMSAERVIKELEDKNAKLENQVKELRKMVNQYE